MDYTGSCDCLIRISIFNSGGFSVKWTPFRWNEPNHGYYGIALIIVSCYLDWTLWLLIPGIILVVDEITQLWLGQHNGLVHWLYVNTLYRIKIIRELDDFINRAMK